MDGSLLADHLVFLNEDVDGVEVTEDGLIFSEVQLGLGQPVQQTLDGIRQTA